MGPKFTILFTYMDFLFIAEIRKQLVDRVPVYDVLCPAANPDSVELEIYRFCSRSWYILETET
jgi:hypothetical protein